MNDLTLFIGNRNYSSWSLRGWLALRLAGLAFTERLIPLDTPETAAALAAVSPAGTVPVLSVGGVTIGDSLAIGEFAADLAPDARLLPADPVERALCRAAVAEMHAGFGALRGHLPMNIRGRFPHRATTPEVDRDIARITALWRGLRARAESEGPFLFGRVTLADVAYAPVATRFRTYGVALDLVSAAYVEAVLALPAMAEWTAEAIAEPWIIGSAEF